MLGVLWALYLTRTIRLGGGVALENLRELKFLDLLNRDIILRLCKLRDDDSRNLSFQQVWKSERKRSTRLAALDGVEVQIRRFGKLTQNLERHRSNYVAHLAKHAPDDLSPAFEITEATLLALTIVDRLLGERCEYTIEGIDLREAAFHAVEA